MWCRLFLDILQSNFCYLVVSIFDKSSLNAAFAFAILLFLHLLKILLEPELIWHCASAPLSATNPTAIIQTIRKASRAVLSIISETNKNELGAITSPFYGSDDHHFWSSKI